MILNLSNYFDSISVNNEKKENDKLGDLSIFAETFFTVKGLVPLEEVISIEHPRRRHLSRKSSWVFKLHFQ